MVLAACGGSPPEVVAPSPPALSPLITLAPPESTLVVVARPAELTTDEATGRVIRALFPAEQLDRFTQRTGVDPRALEELVIAEHPDGRVVLARGPFDAPFAVREAGARMAPLESSVDAPQVRRAGFLGERRIDLSALGPHAVSWVEGSPQLAAAVLDAAAQPASARAHIDRSTDAELREAAGDAPFALYALRPLALPRDTGIGMLLARERALATWLQPTEAGALRIALELHGEFPDGAAANFRALARSLADTDLGAALGAREAMPSLRIESETRRVRLTAELDPTLLAMGLRTLFSAEMEQLFSEQALEARSRARDDDLGSGEPAVAP